MTINSESFDDFCEELSSVCGNLRGREFFDNTIA